MGGHRSDFGHEIFSDFGHGLGHWHGQIGLGHNFKHTYPPISDSWYYGGLVEIILNCKKVHVTVKISSV